MKQTTWKYVVDVVMFLAMVGIILIGLLLAFIIKEGPTAQAGGKYFLDLHRHQWSNIHLFLSLFFSGALVFHLILEWSWIKGKTKTQFKGAGRPEYLPGWDCRLTCPVETLWADSSVAIHSLFWICEKPSKG